MGRNSNEVIGWGPRSKGLVLLTGKDRERGTYVEGCMRVWRESPSVSAEKRQLTTRQKPTPTAPWF